MAVDQKRRHRLAIVVFILSVVVFVFHACCLSYNLGRLHEYERTHPFEPKFQLFGE